MDEDLTFASGGAEDFDNQTLDLTESTEEGDNTIIPRQSFLNATLVSNQKVVCRSHNV